MVDNLFEEFRKEWKIWNRMITWWRLLIQPSLLQQRRNDNIPSCLRKISLCKRRVENSCDVGCEDSNGFLHKHSQRFELTLFAGWCSNCLTTLLILKRLGVFPLIHFVATALKYRSPDTSDFLVDVWVVILKWKCRFSSRSAPAVLGRVELNRCVLLHVIQSN